MRDVTNRRFCDLFMEYGEPNFYVSEFLRVHDTSGIEKNIEDFLLNRKSTHPLFIQLLGREPSAFVRIAKQLSQFNIAGIDLNFGCPMPKICKKGTGGMLLDEPLMIEKIIAELKDNISLPISAKIRIGVLDDSNFDQILQTLSKFELFGVTVHARTVHGLYRERVSYEHVKRAKQALNCPVFANGDICSAQQALDVAELTGCDGVMIGRAAIRNPYIFSQIQQKKSAPNATFNDIKNYIERLLNITAELSHDEHSQVCLMKKYLNFIGQSVDANGEFLHHMRRAMSKNELLNVIDKYVTSMGQAIFPDEPYPGIVARPNRE